MNERDQNGKLRADLRADNPDLDDIRDGLKMLRDRTEDAAPRNEAVVPEWAITRSGDVRTDADAQKMAMRDYGLKHGDSLASAFDFGAGFVRGVAFGRATAPVPPAADAKDAQGEPIYQVAEDESKTKWRDLPKSEYELYGTIWKRIVYAAPLPRASDAPKVDAPGLLDALWLEISELPDRNSPEDEPDACIVNHDELAGALERAIERVSDAPATAAQAGATHEQFDNLLREYGECVDMVGRAVKFAELSKIYGNAIAAPTAAVDDGGEALPNTWDIDSLISIWSMRPQPGSPSGVAWEQGARQGWKWAKQYASMPERKAVTDERINEAFYSFCRSMSLVNVLYLEDAHKFARALFAGRD
ncbi:hypothetical protein [Paraburkholderia sp. 2C]